ncbi:MAG TPA: glycosyltransferase [Streptosporangiaceae bacterium]|nr:glycosyltransferase [Streptosporangiaceae bacterium]
MSAQAPPLPAGFGIAFDPATEVVGSDVLFGGSPPRLLRLNAAGQRALAELRGGQVRSAAGGTLARRLTDTGLAHPRPPAQEPAGRAGAREVTVVIPVRDRPAGLDTCLSALAGSYPVIVVDDGSLDAAAVATACAKHGACLVRRPEPAGPGQARNDGLARAATPLIAFLDSDCAAGPEWIAALAGHFADPLVAAAAPRVVAKPGHGLASRYMSARAPLDMGPQESRVLPLTRVSYVPTAALLVRRAALTTATAAEGTSPAALSVPARGSGLAPAPVGTFDPDLRYGEDVDLIWRLTGAGWRVRYDPSAVVCHCDPEGWPALLARRFRYGRSAAPLARRHPGHVPSLVVQAWPGAVTAALLARKPATALAAYGLGTWQLAALLRGWGVPPTGILRPMAESVLQTWLGTGRWSVQFALPVVAAALAQPGAGHPGQARLRLGRRAALASLLIGPPVAEWLRSRPDMGVLAFAACYLADEAAYGAGVYQGSLTERLATPLLPRLAPRPLQKADPHPEH